MTEPSIILGVPFMDRDHAALEDLLAKAAVTEDAALAKLLDEIEAETRAHFQREEALMREQCLAVLPCHMMQHEMLLSRFQLAHGAVICGDDKKLRQFLTDTLPALLFHHMNTADRVTAGMLLSASPVDL